MKKLIQLLEAKVKLNSSGCPNIEVDSDISLDLVNDALLNGICSAAKAAGVNVKITTATSDHPVETNSGSISRHSTGNGVDISIINGKAVKDASNKPNVDNFVDKLEQLDNSFHQLSYLINTQDTYQAKEFMDSMREKIADIQTLINTNTED